LGTFVARHRIDYEEYTGLSAKQLEAVGFISLAWNGLETGLSVLAWELADWPKNIGELVTTDLGNVSKAQLFDNLVKLIIKEPRLTAECEDLSMFFDNLRERRNKLVHSVIRLSATDAKPSRLVKRSAKARSGSVTETEIIADLAALNALAQDIKLCADAMRPIFRKVWWHQYYEKNHKPTDPTPIGVFVHQDAEPSDGIAQLQTRVATLFPQRHAQRNKRPQPRKSQK